MLPTTLTYDRSVLLLEGLWDQLESVAASLRMSEEQPNSIRVVRSRIAVYRIRLREIIAKIQNGGTAELADATQHNVAATLLEVVELLDSMQDDPPTQWITVLYQAQDAVLASLHDLRRIPRAKDSASSAVFA